MARRLRGKRMKIALFTYSLRAGGAERVVSHMASHWAKKGHDVTVLTLESVERDFYPLNPAVQRICVGNVGTGPVFMAPWRLVQRVLHIRRAVKSVSPDVLLSFMVTMNILALLATRGL